MARYIRVACIQLTSGPDKATNLEKAERLVNRAAGAGAEVIVLPERWNATGDAELLWGAAEQLDCGETVAAMSQWARRHGVTLVGGSITERREGREKLSNTCVVFDVSGQIAGIYRKIHLFDVDVGGQRYRESEMQESGDEPALALAGDWRVGLSICYDIRFPELYRIIALEEAELVTVPAAFTLFTGKDHWHLLLRARAVENQLYIAAAGQCGEPVPGKPTYGRSLICDPWGTVLVQAPDEETVIWAELDREHLLAIRRNLPSLANRQPAAYRSPSFAEGLLPS